MKKPTLKEAIKDERGAVPFYNSLKKAATSKRDKKVYASIIRDEKKHKKLLMTLQKRKK